MHQVRFVSIRERESECGGGTHAAETELSADESFTLNPHDFVFLPCNSETGKGFHF